jgi:hypothetical protein
MTKAVGSGGAGLIRAVTVSKRERAPP